MLKQDIGGGEWKDHRHTDNGGGREESWMTTGCSGKGLGISLTMQRNR